MPRRRLDPWSIGLAATALLTACGSRTSLELSIDSWSTDSGVGGDDGLGAGGNTGGSGGRSSGGQNAGGTDTGGRHTGGRSAGGADTGGQNTGGQGAGGQGAGGADTGGQGSGGGAMCPFGYVDEGDGCQPILTDLVPTFGSVSPAVGALVRDYFVSMPLWTHGMTLSPYTADGVSIVLFGQDLASGDPWKTPGLNPGAGLASELILSAAGHPSTQYQLAVMREGVLTYFKASNTGEGAAFGSRIALSLDGQTLAVAAPVEDGAASGINGDQSDLSATGAGAVYVFVKDGSAWMQQAYIKASNPDAGDGFGRSLDLSGDGNVLVVGAWGEDSAATGVDGDASDDAASFAGAAYVFTRTGTTWVEEAYVKASNTEWGDIFGCAVALSGDGATFAVGAYGEDSGAEGANGDQARNDASMSGAVYVFSRAGGGVVQEAYLKASNPDPNDSFGIELVLSGDGSTLAVTAEGEDGGSSGINGDQTDDTASNSGAVYLFSRAGSSWSQVAYVKASNTGEFDMFGYATDLSNDGSTLAIGAFAEQSLSSGIGGDQENDSSGAIGAVYVLGRSGASWAHEEYIKASNPHSALFGTSVRLSENGDVLYVGAIGEDSTETGIDPVQPAYLGELDSGAVYRFTRAASVWAQSAYIKAPNTGADDSFGRAVATSSDGSVLAASASLEDCSSTGINGDQSNDDAPDSGAVYVFAAE